MTVDDVKISVSRPIHENDFNFWVDVEYKDIKLKVFIDKYIPMTCMYEKCINAIEKRLK